MANLPKTSNRDHEIHFREGWLCHNRFLPVSRKWNCAAAVSSCTTPCSQPTACNLIFLALKHTLRPASTIIACTQSLNIPPQVASMHVSLSKTCA